MPGAGAVELAPGNATLPLRTSIQASKERRQAVSFRLSSIHAGYGQKPTTPGVQRTHSRWNGEQFNTCQAAPALAEVGAQCNSCQDILQLDATPSPLWGQAVPGCAQRLPQGRRQGATSWPTCRFFY
ncbi:hypothetical protein B0T14DRAFT_519224 [Immersiella caudata]|uniref:Uncharacterized protein n=1 Tax=Immersiella caudata TaxID=314043 RepID=A0AA39WQ04_9PEZI|nr:hypothetical protein B0T14DRAFT_519224 [Immersiella caudata]